MRYNYFSPTTVDVSILRGNILPISTLTENPLVKNGCELKSGGRVLNIFLTSPSSGEIAFSTSTYDTIRANYDFTSSTAKSSALTGKFDEIDG